MDSESNDRDTSVIPYEVLDEKEYAERVIRLFRYGKPTSKQWSEMADAVLNASENRSGDTFKIDLAIYGIDEASCHTFDCRCPVCLEWWVDLGPGGGLEGNHGPFTDEELRRAAREREEE